MTDNKQTELKRVTLLELWKNKQFTGISKLAYNQNNYPFLTMVKGKAANNLYFSKAAAEKVKNNFVAGDDLLANGFLKDGEVVMTENKEGNVRFKISIPSLESNYSSTAALQNAFGSQNDTEFDLKAFSDSFTTSEMNAVKVTPEVTEQQS